MRRSLLFAVGLLSCHAAIPPQKTQHPKDPVKSALPLDDPCHPDRLGFAGVDLSIAQQDFASCQSSLLPTVEQYWSLRFASNIAAPWTNNASGLIWTTLTKAKSFEKNVQCESPPALNFKKEEVVLLPTMIKATNVSLAFARDDGKTVTVAVRSTSVCQGVEARGEVRPLWLSAPAGRALNVISCPAELRAPCMAP